LTVKAILWLKKVRIIFVEVLRYIPATIRKSGILKFCCTNIFWQRHKGTGHRWWGKVIEEIS